MKFYIPDGSGHRTLVVEGEKAKKEFSRLIGEGYRATTKDGKRVEKCPDTVKELVFGREFRHTGLHGD